VPGTGFRSRESFFPLLASVKPELQREVKDLLRSVIFQNDPATVIPSHTHAGTDITSSGLVADGFSGTDLSGTGPGVLIQASSGASFTLENPLSVARGGTGAATLPSHQILYGSGTSAISSSTSLIFNPTNGYLSLNISEVNTQSRIHAFGSSAATSSLLLERASADAFGAYTYHLKSRLAYKSATVVNDYSGGPIFSIYNSVNVWKDVAAIWGQATNVTSGTEAGDIVFFCATDGAIADADERMRISSAGVLTVTGSVTAPLFTGPATALKSATTSVSVSAATAPTIGQLLTAVDGTTATWQAPAAAAVPTAITVADESADTTCFPLFVTAATGDLGPKTNAGLTYNSSTGQFGTSASVNGAVTLRCTNTAAGTAAYSGFYVINDSSNGLLFQVLSSAFTTAVLRNRARFQTDGGIVGLDINITSATGAFRNIVDGHIVHSHSKTEFVVNEDGWDHDARFEGDTATKLLVCDGGLDAVQIGTTVAAAIADFRATSITLKQDTALSAALDHDGSTAGFFGTAPTTKPTALTTALTTITASAPGTPDYAIADLTAGGFGFVAADEGQTVLTVVANLQARVNELETKLQSLGLLT